MKARIEDYITFTKREKGIALIFGAAIVFLIVLPYVWPYSLGRPTNEEIIKKQLDSIFQDLPESETKVEARNDDAQWTDARKHIESENVSNIKAFPFDPNNLDEAGWTKLGLREKLVRTILNYRSKGGRFRNPEDIRKIWGIREEEATALIPFVRLPDEKKPHRTEGSKGPQKPSISIQDVNVANESELKPIPGMENFLNYKIVRYRQKLGGFIAIGQLKEVEGMTDSLFEKMVPFLLLKSTDIIKLDLNRSSKEELGRHPYIGWTIGKSIVAFRETHGAFKTIDDVKKIVFIKEPMFEKFKPYIKVE